MQGTEWWNTWSGRLELRKCADSNIHSRFERVNPTRGWTIFFASNINRSGILCVCREEVLEATLIEFLRCSNGSERSEEVVLQKNLQTPQMSITRKPTPSTRVGETSLCMSFCAAGYCIGLCVSSLSVSTTCRAEWQKLFLVSKQDTG